MCFCHVCGLYADYGPFRPYIVLVGVRVCHWCYDDGAWRKWWNWYMEFVEESDLTLAPRQFDRSVR